MLTTVHKCMYIYLKGIINFLSNNVLEALYTLTLCDVIMKYMIFEYK